MLIALVAWLATAVPAHAATVEVAVADAVTLHADQQGGGPRGVVLLHDEGRSSKDWATVSDYLAQQGFHVLRVDLRGHGASAGTADEAGYAAMGDDVARAVALLRSEGVEHVALVGAGLGANLALHVASTDPAVSGVALLSPRLSAQGYRSTTALAAYGARPLMLAGGSEDASSSRAITTLAGRASGPVTSTLLDTDARGTNLFNQGARLQADLIGWLNRVTTPAALPDAAALTPTAGAVDEVQTTGRRFGE